MTIKNTTLTQSDKFLLNKKSLIMICLFMDFRSYNFSLNIQIIEFKFQILGCPTRNCKCLNLYIIINKNKIDRKFWEEIHLA